jgi:FkbM family methyltransferase
MIRKIKLFILNLLDLPYIINIIPLRDIPSYYFTFYFFNTAKLTAIRIKALQNEKVLVRRGSIIDRDVIKYVFHKQHHLPQVPLQPHSIIVDLGSNIGLTLVHFRKLYPDSILSGYEMEGDNFKIAVRNCTGFGDCRIHHAAVWNKSETVNYDMDACEDAYQITENESKKKLGGNLESVQAVTMYNIIAGNHFSQIDYLKIDIEGSEKNLLSDPSPDWLQIVRQLNIEIHDVSFLKKAIDILERYGFACKMDARHKCLIHAIKRS